MLKKIASYWKNVVPRNSVEHLEPSSFYKVSKTCQVPRLGELYELFWGSVTDGTFVEIGAFDGEYVSNTSCLADVGWNGFYIEPIHSHYEKCVARHSMNSNTRVVNVGISSTPGTKDIYSLGPLSTLDDASYNNLTNLEWAHSYTQLTSKETVSLMRLDDFLTHHNIPVKFNLLVVDVEGYEYDVFESFSLQKWLPSVLIIELHDISPDYISFHYKLRLLHSSIIATGYMVVYKDFTNTIFLRNDEYLL